MGALATKRASNKAERAREREIHTFRNSTKSTPPPAATLNSLNNPNQQVKQTDGQAISQTNRSLRSLAGDTHRHTHRLPPPPPLARRQHRRPISPPLPLACSDKYISLSYMLAHFVLWTYTTASCRHHVRHCHRFAVITTGIHSFIHLTTTNNNNNTTHRFSQI